MTFYYSFLKIQCHSSHIITLRLTQIYKAIKILVDNLQVAH